jgi:hypothetical protein
MTEYLYRYEDWLFGSGVHIEAIELPIVKKTECGAWVYDGLITPENPTEFFETLVKEKRLRKECRFILLNSRKKCRFILLNSRKKYACLTREAAMQSFRARKRAQIRILEHRLHRAKEALFASGVQPDESGLLFIATAKE